MQRRLLLKLTGCAVAAGALGVGAVRVAAGSRGTASTLRPPGSYQISGVVRLEAPTVEISGISNAQQISWSEGALNSPLASFTSFERFDQPWQMPGVIIRGGRLEALSVQPLDFS
jgi:hypothetical protein